MLYVVAVWPLVNGLVVSMLDLGTHGLIPLFMSWHLLELFNLCLVLFVCLAMSTYFDYMFPHKT